MRAGNLREFMSSIDRATLPGVEEATQAQSERDAAAMYRAYMDGHVQPSSQYRRAIDAEESDDAKMEKGYSGGADYVSQSREALRHHAERQTELNASRASRQKQEEEPGQRRVEGTAQRQDGANKAPKSGSSAAQKDGETTGAKETWRDRLLDEIGEEDRASGWDDPGRQPKAPGGGRTRSR
jgi:hypothetical protein